MSSSYSVSGRIKWKKATCFRHCESSLGFGITQMEIQILLFGNYISWAYCSLLDSKLPHLQMGITLSKMQNWCEDQMKSQIWHISQVAEVAVAYLFPNHSTFTMTSYTPTFIMVLHYSTLQYKVNAKHQLSLQ